MVELQPVQPSSWERTCEQRLEGRALPTPSMNKVHSLSAVFENYEGGGPMAGRACSPRIWEDKAGGSLDPRSLRSTWVNTLIPS